MLIWIRRYFLFLYIPLFLTAGENEIVLMAAGDLNLAHWITPIMITKGVDYPYKNLDDTLDKSDIFFANLESPFCDSGQAAEKNFVFKTPTKYSSSLIKGRINLVSLANNHIMDYGNTGLFETTRELDKLKIVYAGVGINDKLAQRAGKISIENTKIALFAYSMTLPKCFWATDSSAGTAYPRIKSMADSIRYYDDLGYFVVVSFHWGKELQISPDEYQIRYAHKAIDAGADLILGHHPHVIQGIEYYKNKLIFYSLGNYIFASYSKKATEGIIAQINIVKNTIKAASVIPINVDNYKVAFQPKKFRKEDAKFVYLHINSISKELNKDLQIVDEYGNILIN